MSCKNCLYLNKSKVQWNKETKVYRYGCSKSMSGHVPVWLSADNEEKDLGMTGCGRYESKKNPVLHVGDAFKINNREYAQKYIYCGIVNGKRLVFGGEVKRGRVTDEHFCLWGDEIGDTLKRFNLTVVSFHDDFAKQKKKEYCKKVGVKL